MNSSYTIRSKINVKPKKKAYIFNILLNICLVVVMISGIIKIIFDGLDISTLGTMAVAIVIVSLYKKRPSNTEHYEFSLVDVMISNTEITLIYHQIESYRNNDFQVCIPLSKINVLEFSDRLCCLHVNGTVTGEILDGKKIIEEYTDHYLYLEQGMEREIITSVQQASGISVRYMDR